MATPLKTTSPYSLCKIKKMKMEPQAEIEISGKCKGCCKTLSERLLSSIGTNCLTDLTIAFANGQSIRKVHRLLLGLSSPVFEAMLYGPMAVGDVLYLPGDDPIAFKWVLGYLYFSRRDLPSNLAPQVYQLAHKYFLCDLHELCTKNLMENINQVNFPMIYDIAVLTENKALMSQCQLVLWQTDSVLSSPNFGCLSRVALRSLLLETSFEPTSDILLFKAIVTWGRHKVLAGASHEVEAAITLGRQMPRKQEVFIEDAFIETELSREQEAFTIETDTCKEKVAAPLEIKIPEKLGTVILDAHTDNNVLRHEIVEFLQEVRFLTMTTDEFTQIVIPSGVFTSEESIAILLKIKDVPGSCLPAVAQCESRYRPYSRDTFEVLFAELQEDPKVKPAAELRRTNSNLVFRRRMEMRRLRMANVLWKY